MEDRIRLSYFYGKEADQFSFYKIPKLLFTEQMHVQWDVQAILVLHVIHIVELHVVELDN